MQEVPGVQSLAPPLKRASNRMELWKACLWYSGEPLLCTVDHTDLERPRVIWLLIRQCCALREEVATGKSSLYFSPHPWGYRRWGRVEMGVLHLFICNGKGRRWEKDSSPPPALCCHSSNASRASRTKIKGCGRGKAHHSALRNLPTRFWSPWNPAASSSCLYHPVG